MNAYAFEGKPGQGKPKGVKSRKCSSTADFRNVYPWPHLSEPMSINTRPHALAINCAAPASMAVRISTESPRKPLKTRYLSKKVAGGESRDVDVAWREQCAA